MLLALPSVVKRACEKRESLWWLLLLLSGDRQSTSEAGCSRLICTMSNVQMKSRRHFLCLVPSNLNISFFLPAIRQS